MVLDGPLAFCLLLSYTWRRAVVPKWSRLNFTKWQLGAASGACWSADGSFDFVDRQEFELWAQTALALRRNDPDVWQWPEAVRVCDAGNQELYVWTLWDQVQRREADRLMPPRSSRREAPFVKQHKTLKGIMPAMAAGVRQALQPVFILRSRNRPSYRRTREIPRR